MFSVAPKDMEDFGIQKPSKSPPVRVATVTKRKRGTNSDEEFTEDQLSKTWRDVLGNPPPLGKTKVDYDEHEFSVLMLWFFLGRKIALVELPKKEVAVSSDAKDTWTTNDEES